MKNLKTLRGSIHLHEYAQRSLPLSIKIDRYAVKGKYIIKYICIYLIIRYFFFSIIIFRDHNGNKVLTFLVLSLPFDSILNIDKYFCIFTIFLYFLYFVNIVSL